MESGEECGVCDCDDNIDICMSDSGHTVDLRESEDCIKCVEDSVNVVELDLCDQNCDVDLSANDYDDNNFKVLSCAANNELNDVSMEEVDGRVAGPRAMGPKPNPENGMKMSRLCRRQYDGEGYETDEAETSEVTSSEGDIINNIMINENIGDDIDEQLLLAASDDLYSGYNFDVRELKEGNEDLQLILNSIYSTIETDKKKKRKTSKNKNRSKGRDSDHHYSVGYDELQDLLDDWDDRESSESDSDEAVVGAVSEDDQSSSGSEDEVEVVDNITYHEDSLSVMRGTVDTPLGEALAIHIVSDTGAMTQLMEKKYAKAMKFEESPMPRGKSFNIRGPGGGKERVNRRVTIQVTLKMGEIKGDENLVDGQALEMEESVTIPMSFGLVDSLPVPVLWGGGQMRRLHAHDLHEKKLITMRLEEDRRMAVRTRSWLASCAEMKQFSDKRLLKAVKSFLPSNSRMVNMVTGGRDTKNTQAALYPGRDNIVRLARSNARVDEGLNEVDLVNVEEIEKEYGGMITVISSINNGEAFIIVRNNVERTLSLPAGKLKIKVKPVLSLPICRTATPEFQELKRNYVERHGHGAVIEARDQGAARVPRSTVTWCVNGLSARIKAGDLDKMHKYIMDFSPDMVCLQDVKWQSMAGDHTKIRPEGEDYAYYQMLVDTLKDHYKIYLNLSDKENYGGQVILIKSKCLQPTMYYNFKHQSMKYAHGRVCRVEYGSIIYYTLLAPFNGQASQSRILRRQKWDAALAAEMTTNMDGPPRCLLGNFNAVLADTDMSDTPEFWFKQGEKAPGRTALRVEELFDIGDEGFGGTTANERMRFDEWMQAGDFVDTSRKLGRTSKPREWTYQGTGRCKDKGLVFDYAMAPSFIVESGSVEASRVFKPLQHKDSFLGSDHKPRWFSLRRDWEERVQQHGQTQDAMQAAREDVLREERIRDALCTRYTLATMFRNNANKLCPKANSEPGELEQVEQSVNILHAQLKSVTGEEEVPGDEVRPDDFPLELWELVDPRQRKFVVQRFEKFKDREYRQECVDKILNDLDINDTETLYQLEWGDTTVKGAEDKIMRAQALANIDIYFFAEKDTAELAKDVVAEINTVDEKAMRCRPRKLSVVQQAFLEAKTNLMERVGKLEESTSQWCHGLVLVAYEERIKAFMDRQGDTAMQDMFKAEHEVEVATFFRLCIDLRMLNSKTIPDIFPLPRIDDLIESIPRHCGRYSISDICDAFFTCELRKEHRDKTAFKTHNRHLQFAVLPQGFINSPSIFSRMIAKTFEGMDRDKFSAYIDDVLNHTDDFKDHLSVQQEMYDRLRDSRLTVKVAKTHLNQTRVKFLGHILTKDGRLPDPKAVEAISEWRDPKSTKEVRSFLGATLYYREYIYQYADMAMPLYELIRKGVVVEKEWDDQKHGEAVRRIKQALISRPVLMNVDNTKPFRLKVDACRVGRGIGCILEQQNEEGKWQPVSYYSSSLSSAERQYSATELECKALHDCIVHYAIYLKYIPHFEVFSDHNALKYMVNSDKATTNGRLMRYLMELQGYNFSLYYRKGIENQDADAVSRLLRTSDEPIFLTEDQLRDESGVVSKQMLFRARKLDAMTKKTEKEAQKLLRKMKKIELREMAEINDRILAEGVENLESETGRQRFYDNLRESGVQSSKEVVDTTIEDMLLCMEIDEQVVGYIDAISTIGHAEECDSEEVHEPMANIVLLPEEDTDSRGYVMDSWDNLPELFVNMAAQVKKDNQDRVTKIGNRYDIEELQDRRKRLLESAKERVDNGWRVVRDPMVNCVKKHNLRKRVEVDYLSKERVQPNLNYCEIKPKRSEVNRALQQKRKLGHKRVEVRQSLLGETAGDGLFARCKIKEKEILCSYEGVQVTLQQLDGPYGNRDYVAGARKDSRSEDLVYVDAHDKESCYGRYINDPIDEFLVNAKIVWRDNQLVVITTGDIEEGEEIYVSYAGDYWQSRLHHLTPELKARVMLSYPGEKVVRFENDAARVIYKEDCSPKTAMSSKNVQVVEELVANTPKNRLTRLRESSSRGVELEEDPNLAEELLRAEDYEYENVNQCEALAEELRPLLVGRKYVDNENDKLYEIYQVRYDPESEMIIGFRKPLSGTTDRRDGSAYAVYGKEGLFELSERYLLAHPEERITVDWPTSMEEWAELQMDDEELLEMINQIRDAGGGPTVINRSMFELRPTGKEDMKVLTRINATGDKGKTEEQIVVPMALRKLALRIHHEGFSHLGGSRMYATMKLRYFWPGMEKETTEHVHSCINCKLRKSYQRRASVPVMEYKKIERVLDRVHMDLTGPLPTTKEGNKYILVIKDYLSKYVWLIALHGKTMEEVAIAFVNEFVCQAGIPALVVSDRGN